MYAVEAAKLCRGVVEQVAFVQSCRRDLEGALAALEEMSKVAERAVRDARHVNGLPHVDYDAKPKLVVDNTPGGWSIPTRLELLRDLCAPQTKERTWPVACGECHLHIGETCDICGATDPLAS